MAKHITQGKLGEQISVDYLLKNAYTIEARNYRYKRAEIDIVARKGDLLIFIEVLRGIKHIMQAFGILRQL